MKKPKVSCIIVTYNSATYIKACLEALTQCTYPNKEILLIDNNSKDGTLAIAKKFSSKITIHSLSTNKGYAGGHSYGISKAKSKYVFLLNPDTLVTPNFLEPLVNSLLENSQRAAAQPLVLLSQKPHKINLTGKVTHYLAFDWLRDYKANAHRASGPIVSFSGSGILLDKTAYQEIGGFDQNYFMYYEDSDLSWRFRLQGYALWYCSESKIFHDYKFIPNEQYQAFSQKVFWAERNRLYTFFKNYTLTTLLMLFPVFILMELALLVYFLSKGLIKVKLNSYFSLWQQRKTLLKTRKKIQHSRVINDREITREFKTTIDFVLFDHPVIKYLINPFLQLYWQLLWPLI